MKMRINVAGSPASAPPPDRSLSAVERIAQELRLTALSLEPGGYLGSEEQLGRHFGVSTPTLRQAARLLEHEEIITVRRGVYGGYYAHRPNIETVSRVAATYLRSNPSSIDDIQVLLDALTPMMVDLVIGSERLNELAEFANAEPTASHEELVEVETRFAELLWELTGNAALHLVLSVFFQVGSLVRITTHPPVRDGNLRAQLARRELARALLARDREAATDAAMEHRRLIFTGLKFNDAAT